MSKNQTHEKANFTGETSIQCHEKVFRATSGGIMHFERPGAPALAAPAKNPMGATSAEMSRHELDAKAKAHMSANPGVDYLGAVKAVQCGMAAVPAKFSTPRPDTAMSRQFIDASAKKYMADHPSTDYLAAVKIVQPNI